MNNKQELSSIYKNIFVINQKLKINIHTKNCSNAIDPEDNKAPSTTKDANKIYPPDNFGKPLQTYLQRFIFNRN